MGLVDLLLERHLLATFLSFRHLGLDVLRGARLELPAGGNGEAAGGIALRCNGGVNDGVHPTVAFGVFLVQAQGSIRESSAWACWESRALRRRTNPAESPWSLVTSSPSMIQIGFTVLPPGIRRSTPSRSSGLAVSASLGVLYDRPARAGTREDTSPTFIKARAAAAMPGALASPGATSRVCSLNPSGNRRRGRVGESKGAGAIGPPPHHSRQRCFTGSNRRA